MQTTLQEHCLQFRRGGRPDYTTIASLGVGGFGAAQTTLQERHLLFNNMGQPDNAAKALSVVWGFGEAQTTVLQCHLLCCGPERCLPLQQRGDSR